MSVSPIEQAQSIADEINSEAFRLKLVALNEALNCQLTCTAVRGYIVTFTLQQLRTLRVVCVPKSFRTGYFDQAGWERKHAVDIGILYKLDPQPIRSGTERNDQLDPLMALVNLIVDHFLDPTFETDTGYVIDEELGVQNDPIYSQQSLRESDQFTSVITVHLMEVE